MVVGKKIVTKRIVKSGNEKTRKSGLRDRIGQREMTSSCTTLSTKKISGGARDGGGAAKKLEYFTRI